MKYKTLIFSLILLITPVFSHAQIPFGGRIVMSHECACSGGWMMYIFDQYTNAVLPILFQFGISRLNSNFNIYLPGVSTLGSYTIGGSCTLASTSCYVTIPATGTVSPYTMPGIGTSTF